MVEKRTPKQGGESPVVEKCSNCRISNPIRLGLCKKCLKISVIVGAEDGLQRVLYTPQAHQQIAHESNTSNLLCLGTRGTGKSTWLRWDAIIRCLMFPGFKALILRRKLTDLRKSHLQDIGPEARALGANYRQTTMDVMFPNGSVIQFSHCEADSAIDDYLSSQWDYIGFDELPTFELEQFLKISAAARNLTSKPYKALVRCCGNPLGKGAGWMKSWFVDHTVDLSEYPDYIPEDFEMQFSTFEQNQYLDPAYINRLRNAPPGVRKAWLEGEFVIEGAYFPDFERKRHCIQSLPTIDGQKVTDYDWMKVYRAIDWGYHPDPAVCLWMLVLPNKRAIVFKELTMRRTLAKDFAKEVKRLSKGMRIVETFCDPTMFVKHGEAPYSIGEIFEQNGVPLSPSTNDRELFGYAVHDYLNTTVLEEQNGQEVVLPLVQMVEHACPELVRTLPVLEMDKTNPAKLGDGPDHWVVALAYFCMGGASASSNPQKPSKPVWMLPKRQAHRILGSVTA